MASRDDYATAIIAEGCRRRITPRGIQIALATALVESDLTMYANVKVPESLNLPHDAVGDDGYSVGLFQQQVVWGNDGWWWGDAATCMDPTRSAGLFYDRLARLDYNNPAHTPGSYAQAVQQSAYPDRYDQRMAAAVALYQRLTGGTMAATVDRPDFTQYWVESPNSQDRGGTPIDLWLIHTEEGAMNADALAQWMSRPDTQVSYHYCVSEDPNDHGVTVCDVVDTDRASWSVLDANNRSINLVFAGSYAGWNRTQWLQQAKAIDAAAWLAVQDCRKYGIDIRVIKPLYTLDPPGISDHRYVTEHLGIGTHTDVGPNFPWDVFEAAVMKYADQQKTPPAPKPVTVAPTDPQAEILAQIRGRWAMLGDHTLIEAVAEIRDKLCGTSDASKAGFSW